MTNEEAIEYLRTEYIVAHQISIVPKEVAKLAIEALQKQVPIEPIEKDSDWFCPICGNNVGMDYCICGQRINLK